MRNERERWQKRGVLGDADKVFQAAEKLEVILATSLPEESLIYYKYAKNMREVVFWQEHAVVVAHYAV